MLLGVLRSLLALLDQLSTLWAASEVAEPLQQRAHRATSQCVRVLSLGYARNAAVDTTTVPAAPSNDQPIPSRQIRHTALVHSEEEARTECIVPRAQK